MKMQPYQERAWAEVYIDSLKYNFDLVRGKAGTARLCCVIKANAYGHGAVMLGRLYEHWGADFLAVSNVEEALQLRRAGIRLPILNLGYSHPACAVLLAREEISQCVFSKEYAVALSENAKRAGLPVKVHIKIDTGMGRLGFDGKSGKAEEIEDVYRLPFLCAEGIFTHLASADEGNAGADYTRRQLFLFSKVLDRLRERGIAVGIRHCAGSAALFAYPESHFDMVRAGIALYGVGSLVGLRPALSLKAVVTQLKKLQAGDSVSYGREFVATRPLWVATLPLGYADGLWRSNYHGGLRVRVGGNSAPIIGRICMDQCMVDATDLSDVKVGDVVTVYGTEGENSITSIAEKNGTIGYEILCAIGARIPRVYIKNNEMIAIKDAVLTANA